MNKLIYLFFALGIVCLSCDGRDRKHKTNAEVLQENNLFDSFSEDVKYFPEAYAEVETDTFLNKGYRVYIKNYIDMKSHVLDTFTTDTIIHKHYYRDTASEVIITKEDEIIFEKTLNKEFFIDNDKELASYFVESNLNGVFLDDEQTTLGNSVVLEVFFCIPESDIDLVYSMKINDKGEYTIEEIFEDDVI